MRASFRAMRAASVNLRVRPRDAPRMLRSKLAGQELRLAKAEAPVRLRVCRQRDHDVRPREAALALELVRECLVQGLLQLVAPADADDGNEHQVFAAFDAKAGVLNDELM